MLVESSKKNSVIARGLLPTVHPGPSIEGFLPDLCHTDLAYCSSSPPCHFDSAMQRNSSFYFS